MKKILAVLFCALLICGSGAILTACGHEHTFDQKVATENFIASDATCTTKAKYYYSCACGTKEGLTFEYGNVLDHSYNDYVYNNDAKCGVDGTETAYCDHNCGESYTRTKVGSALEHTYTNYVYNNDAKCEVDGTETATCDNGCGESHTKTKVGTALEHDYGNWISDGNGTHSKICTHDNSHKITEDCSGGTATCSEKALCSSCGSEYGNLMSHKYTTYTYNNDAECEVDGTETAYCDNDCGKSHTRAKIGSALEHAFVFDSKNDPSGTKFPTITKYKCNRCGKLELVYDNEKYSLIVKADADPEKFYEDQFNFGKNIKAMYSEQDEKYGEVLVMETLDSSQAHGGHAVTYYTGLENADLTKYEYVFFYVYNGGSSAKQLIGRFNGILNDNVAKLNPGEWTLVKVEASTFQTSGSYMGILNFDMGATYKFTSFFCITKEGLAAEVEDLINAIPKEGEATVYKIGTAIAAARAAYNGLKPEIQTLVPFDTIDKLIEIEMAFGAKYKVVAPVDSTAIFTEYMADNVNFSVENNDDYSKVLVATANEELAAGANYFKVAYSTTVDLVDCDKVYVDVYNGCAKKAYFGAIYNNAWKTTLVELAPGEWTKVELDVAGLQLGAFGIFGIEASAQYKFSMFYATTVRTTAESVKAMIEALPETINGYDITQIEAARKAYNSLFDDEQALVDNVAKLEEAEAFYAENFAVVLKTDSLASIKDVSSDYNDSSATVLSIVDDATYGKVFKFVQAGSGAVAFTYNTISNEVIAQYKEIVFNVYATSSHPFDAAATGGFTGTGKSLTANNWMTITYSVDQYLAIIDGQGRFGVWGAAAGEYAVATVYLVAYTAEGNNTDGR